MKLRSMTTLLVMGVVAFVGLFSYSALTQVANATSGLTAPQLIAPSNGASVNGAVLKNAWQPVQGAVRYVYESYHDEHAEKLRWSQTVSSTSKTATGVTDGTEFWWRVKAVDTQGRASAWSEMWKVTIDNFSPSIPVNGSPNGSRIQTNDFYFEWDGVVDRSPVKYEFQSSGSNVVDAKGSLVGSWNSIKNGNAEQRHLLMPRIHSTGAPNGTYYWQVRAIDAAGNVSGWSEVWNMGIDPDTTPPVVDITAPLSDYVKGIITVSGTVSDDHPHHYYFVILDKDGNEVPRSKTGAPGTVNQAQVSDWQWDTTKLPDGIYYINLEALDALDNKGVPSVERRMVKINNVVPTATLGVKSTMKPSASTLISLMGHVEVSEVVEMKQLDLYVDGSRIDITAHLDKTTGDWTYDLDGLSKGTHKIAVKVIDTNGNASEELMNSYVEMEVSGYVAPVKDRGAIPKSVAPSQLPQNPNIVSPAAIVRSVASQQPVSQVQNDSSKQNDMAVLGADTAKEPAVSSDSSSRPVVASSNGWTFFGVAWYWWLLIMTVVAGVGSWVVISMKRRTETA